MPRYSVGADGSVADTTKPGNPQIAVVSTMQDIVETPSQGPYKLLLAPTTASAVESFQSDAYLDAFHCSSQKEDEDLLDKLGKYFAMYEIPLGLLSYLLPLKNFKSHFIMDDSGSMNEKSDFTLGDAHPVVQSRFSHQPKGTVLTRWQEAESRLHAMIDILSFIPTLGITISFLNRANVITLMQQGKTSEAFAAEAHEKITTAFQTQLNGYTPTRDALQRVFSEQTPTMVYLFTDGEPTDRQGRNKEEEIAKITQLVMSRNPSLHPLTFVSCTDNDDDTQWMKDVDEKALQTAELDSYEDEATEVRKKHGPVFPFSKGVLLISTLVAAITKLLDGMDEPVPYSRCDMSKLSGYQLSDVDYQRYFDLHPSSARYRPFYGRLLAEDLPTEQIKALPAAGDPRFFQPAPAGVPVGYPAPVYPPYGAAPSYAPPAYGWPSSSYPK